MLYAARKSEMITDGVSRGFTFFLKLKIGGFLGDTGK